MNETLTKKHFVENICKDGTLLKYLNNNYWICPYCKDIFQEIQGLFVHRNDLFIHNFMGIVMNEILTKKAWEEIIFARNYPKEHLRMITEF